jgi:exodeoxyribonuclease V alpha subunit
MKRESRSAATTSAAAAQIAARAERLEFAVRGSLANLLAKDARGSLAQYALADPWALVLAGGLPFEIADRWAAEDGIEHTSSRAPASVVWAVRHALLDRGDMAVPMLDLPRLIQRIRGEPVELDSLANTVHQLMVNGVLEVFGDSVALPSAAATEASLARRITDLLTTPPADSERREALVRRRLAEGTPLSLSQQEAVIAVARHRLVVITGAAGTGKTEVIREINRLYSALGDRVLGATPTGKAADVLHSRGVPQVQTLHATLGITPDDTEPDSYPVESAHPLLATILFVDEATMPDAIIYERLFASLPDNMTVVLVGDVNQLLPVGPGTVYETLVNMPSIVPVIRLTEVRRTAGLLTDNGLAIAEGRMPRFTDPFGGKQDYTAAWYDAARVPPLYREMATKAAKRSTPAEEVAMDAAARWIVDTACSTLMTAYGLSPHEFVQIITPQGPGPLGTIRLGGMMRNRLNPLPPDERDLRWTYQDKVNCLRKRDPILVIGSIKSSDGSLLRNGTAAEVVAIDRASRTFTLARAGGDEYIVPSSASRECMLRYAMTVDRTQGSEYGVVLQVVHDATARSLATRNRYYTGYTRARKASVTWGTDERIRYCVTDAGSDRRYTTLPDRLREELELKGQRAGV